jgi:hypothetical protein
MRDYGGDFGPMVCTEFVRLIFGCGEARAGDFNTLILLSYLVAGERYGLNPRHDRLVFPIDCIGKSPTH